MKDYDELKSLIAEYIKAYDLGEVGLDPRYNRFRTGDESYIANQIHADSLLDEMRKEVLTDNDMRLIDQAQQKHSADWGEIDALIGKADTTSCIYFLRGIRNNKYHLDEYHNGLN